MGLLLIGRAETAPAQAPSSQQAGAVTQQFYVLPTEDAPVQLQTHLVDVFVVDSGDGTVSSYTDATYRIYNTSEAAVTLPLLLYEGKGSAVPQDVSLTADGQSLALGTSAGGYVTEIELEADTRVSLRLQYRVTILDSPLVTVRYAPSVLRRWPGPVSTRIEFAIPDSIARESWTRTTPDSWTYAASQPDFTAIKWLYDSSVPDEEFVVQFVAPTVWSRIRAIGSDQAAVQASLLVERGDLFRTLAEAESADEQTKDRFASQAIAAYTQGLSPEASSNVEASIRMYVGLAGLYRSRAAQPAHDPVKNAELMVAEAASALALLGPQDARRGELQQWLGDGLRILFADAKARGDWRQANEAVQTISALPPGSVDDGLAQEAERMVLMQQAIQLLQRGETDEAAALAGIELTSAAANPPRELQPLFASWQITVTAEPDTVTVDLRAEPAHGREDDARAEFAGLVARWQTESQRAAANSSIEVRSDEADGATPALIAQIKAPIAADGEMLAGFVPSGASWAMVRSALAQLEPKWEERTKFFLREVIRSQPMDLRSAGDQWSAMAANLEHEAAGTETSAEAADVETALLAEMRAANYRSTAEAWRDLERNSWLQFRFTDGDGASEQSRSWYVTATSSPLVFSVQSQTLDTNLMAGFAAIALAAVAGLSGLLWWLM